jgi:hypothetical protein
LAVHAPFWHRPPPQELPQEPQLLASLLVLTQVVPHIVLLVGHVQVLF